MQIITRDQWGARYKDGFSRHTMPLRQSFVHHSVTTHLSPNASIAQERAQMGVLEYIGESRFGGGISYTFVVFPSGRIYAGHNPKKNGAHTAGHNAIAIGICLAGKYSTVAPTEAQLDSVAWLHNEGVRKHLLRSARLTGGHRDVYPTSCPGDVAYAHLDDIRHRIRTGTGLSAGAPAWQTTAHVKRVQALLNDVTDAGLVVDGVPGLKTEAATTPYQEDHGGLTVDGIPGPNTLKALEADMSAITDLQKQVQTLIDEVQAIPREAADRVWSHRIGPKNARDVHPRAETWLTNANSKAGEAANNTAPIDTEEK